MSAKPFLDSNVLLYAFTTDDPRKVTARELIVAGGKVSVQVLNEFVNVSRKKLDRDWSDIRAFLAIVQDRLDQPISLTLGTHRQAISVSERHRISIYDALIVAAAREAGCRILYSEDLQHGRLIDGVTVQNPFRPA